MFLNTKTSVVIKLNPVNSNIIISSLFLIADSAPSGCSLVLKEFENSTL